MMCDVSYYGYFLTKRDHTARDLTELSYKCFDLIKVYGTAASLPSISASISWTSSSSNPKTLAPNIKLIDSESVNDETNDCAWIHAKNMRTNLFGYISCKLNCPNLLIGI